jgi:hypothetical protein
MNGSLHNSIEILDLLLKRVNDQGGGVIDASLAVSMAQVYATVAQVEQLKRIGDLMEIHFRRLKMRDEGR